MLSITEHALLTFSSYSAPVATALLLVGSIYIIIFSFVVTMGGFAVRAPIEPLLTTRELLQLRILAPLILYAPLSFSYAMISLAFKVPFGAKFSYGGGFFLYWVFVYLTMASLGLATEFAIQILSPRFMTFFLFVSLSLLQSLLLVRKLLIALKFLFSSPSLYRTSLLRPYLSNWSLGSINMAMASPYSSTFPPSSSLHLSAHRGLI